MAIYTFTHRCRDVMTLFLLGYLYFCFAISPAKSLDIDTSAEITKGYAGMENCTQCLVKSHLDCTCLLDYTNECFICCLGFSCCPCSDCTSCWHDEQKTTLYEINMYILCGFGIIGLIILYYKICKKIKEQLALTSMRRRLLMERNSGSSTNQNTSEVVQQGPPSYNEVCDAPPLYTSPYNMTSMEEAPPQYPGTPKQERSRDSNLPAAFSVTQHM